METNEAVEEQQTIQQFVDKWSITATATPAPNNPNMSNGVDFHSAADAEWDRTARHWKVKLHMRASSFDGGDHDMTVPFSQGSAHTVPPTAADVLGCLVMDAQGIDDARDFEDWCREYGYDSDSRKAEKTFNVCVRQALKLRQFLGSAYDEAMECTS